MAIGDSNDIFGRLKTLLPHGWFGDSTPVLDAVLRGIASVLANAYSFYAYAKLQCRIATATGAWLDMIAADFGLPQRKANQSDASFRATIIINLFRERGTRNAIIKVLTDLTGRAPAIFEPSRPSDTGALGVNLGLGVAGGVGSLLLPYQAFVTAYRPATSGIPYLPGLGTAPCGLGIAAGGAVLGSMASMQGSITDSDIYSALDSVKALGTTVWARIQ